MKEIPTGAATVLREIRLKNLAIAREVSVSLGEGMNVLTGSTGAGKSLVVQAVRWLRGEKTSENLIRKGADRASATAVFDLSSREDLLQLLSTIGIDPPEDGIITLRRELRRGGKSVAFLDGRRTSAAQLELLCSHLLQLQSQHQQTRLLDPAHHVQLLDDCGVDPSLPEKWNEGWEDWRRRRDELELWKRRSEEFRAQREIYDYQLRELESAGLEEGEMERLRERVALMSGGVQLLEAIQEARELLEEEDKGALPRLSRALSKLTGRTEEISDLRESGELLLQAEDLLRDAVRQLERFEDNAHFDPRQLDADQERLAQLEGLVRKYGRNEHELLHYLEDLGSRLDEEGNDGRAPARLVAALSEATASLEEAGTSLLKARRSIASRVSREASALLEELGMPRAELAFDIQPRRDPDGPLRIQGVRVSPHRNGPHEVRLFLRANPGEAMGPLEKAASGGELSRIGLILRTLAVQGRQPALLVLDEVDAGIGADLGGAMARRLQAMSSLLQLLVITHLPAVAAVGRWHLVARKDSQGERTLSTIVPVEGKSRVEELARMIGGKGSSAIELAQKLLLPDPEEAEA